MKMQLSKRAMLYCCLFIFLLTAQVFSASLDAVLKDAQDGKLDDVTLVEAMLVASGASSSEVSQLKSKADSKLSPCLVSGGPQAGKEDKQAESTRKCLTSKVLKQYYPGSPFKTTMDNGNYDPLWGTAILVQALKKSKFKCSVIETPANYLVSVKSGGAETLFDIFAGKNPVKTSFNEYISKSAGLRGSFDVKKFPPFNLSSAKRTGCSRMIAGALMKRLIQDLKDENFDDYANVFPKIWKTFPDVIIDQDKIVSELAKKLKTIEDPTLALKLVAIANDTVAKVKVNTKDVKDNAVLAARKSYLAVKGLNDAGDMEKFLKKVKPLVAKDVYAPMAKEGYLTIFNSHWKKKNYSKAEKYAYILWKDLKVTKAKPFYVKALLYQAQQLGRDKKYNKAMDKLNAVLKIDKKNENAVKLKEWVYKTQYNEYKTKNDYPNMIKHLTILKKLYPANDEYQKGMIRTYWTWGNSYLVKGEFKEGIDILSKGYKKFSDYQPLKELLESAYWNYAVDLAKKNKLLTAIEELKKANDLFGDDSPRRNQFIADLYLKQSIREVEAGKRSKAMTYAEKCLIYVPEYPSCKAQLDNLKRGKGSVEEEKIEFAPWD